MNFGNFDHSTTLSHLVSQYETTTQNGCKAFFDENTFLQLVDYYEKEGMSNRVSEILEHAIDCHQFSASLYLRKAIFLIQAKREREALIILDHAEALSPKDLHIPLLRAEALTFLDRGIESLSILEHLKKQVEGKFLSEVYFSESLVYEYLEQYDYMFYSLKKALHIHPENQAALQKIWFCVELSKKYEESILLHNQLLEQNAYLYQAWYNLAHSQAYLGNYEDAIEAYEYAYLINEDFEFAYRDRAEICYETKNYKTALRCYEEVLELFEPDADLFLKAGQCHYHLNNIRSAKNCLTQAMFLEPMNEDAFYYIGLCYAAERDWDNAINFYQKAIDLEEHREEYFLSLALAYEALGTFECAEETFRLAADTAPEEAIYWFYYAKFLLETSREEEALEALEEAEDYAIGADLSLCKVACLLYMHKRDQAFSLLNETLEEEPESYHFLFKLVPQLAEDSIVKAIISFHQEIF